MKQASAADDLAGVIQGFLLIAVGAPLVVALRAIVLAKYWQWFMVPLFGFEPLTVFQSLAVMMVAGLLTKSPWSVEANKELSPLANISIQFGSQIMSAALSLAFGWCLSWFIAGIA